MVKYLITAGNSQTGKATIEALQKLGEHDIVAGARDPIKSEAALKTIGVNEVVEFDFTKPATVEKALQGIERVLIVHGPDNLPTFPIFAQVVVDAAKKTSSVKVIGKIAGYFSDANSDLAYAKIHGQVYSILEKSGYQFFTVGPAFFYENWFFNKQAIQSGTLYGAAGDAKVMYIAVADIGAVAAIAFTNIDKYNGHHIPMASEVVSEPEILKSITEAIGIEAKYQNLSLQKYEEYLRESGVPEDAAAKAAMYEAIKAKGEDETKFKSNLKEILGREPLTSRTWAHTVKSNFL